MREWVAHGKMRQTMKWAEFCGWMRDKTLYFNDLYWIRKWGGDGWTDGKPEPGDPPQSFPPGAFVLPDTFQLKPAHPAYNRGTGKGALAAVTTGGKNFWDCDGYCRASLSARSGVVYLTYR